MHIALAEDLFTSAHMNRVAACWLCSYCTDTPLTGFAAHLVDLALLKGTAVLQVLQMLLNNEKGFWGPLHAEVAHKRTILPHSQTISECFDVRL